MIFVIALAVFGLLFIGLMMLGLARVSADADEHIHAEFTKLKADAEMNAEWERLRNLAIDVYESPEAAEPEPAEPDAPAHRVPRRRRRAA